MVMVSIRRGPLGSTWDLQDPKILLIALNPCKTIAL